MGQLLRVGLAEEHPIRQAAPRDLVTNTVAIPRSALGGEGSDEWGPVLGVIAGGLFPYPLDDHADLVFCVYAR